MAGAYYGTRSKKAADGRTKWYTIISVDQRKTTRFAGYRETDATKLGIHLVSEYNNKRANVFTETTKGLNDAIEAFCSRVIDRADRPIKDLTHDHNRRQLQKFLDGSGVQEIDAITKTTLVEWDETMKKRGNSPNTRNISHKTIKCFLNFCVDNGWIKANPFPRKLMTAYHSAGHFYTESERALLLGPTPPTNGQVQPEQVKADRLISLAIQIAQFQGIRLSQIWSLKLSDYDAAENRLSTIGIKRKGDKDVLCHPSTIKALREAAQINECLPTERVFKNWGSSITMGQAFRRKRDRLHITGRFHDNKHTAVSELKRQGFNDVEIEDITNTDRKTIAEVYSHADQEKLAEKFAKFTFEEGR